MKFAYKIAFNQEMTLIRHICIHTCELLHVLYQIKNAKIQTAVVYSRLAYSPCKL